MSAVEGDEAVLRELERLTREAPRAMGAALYEEGQAIEQASMPLVPVDSGRLQATHYTSPPTDSPQGPEVTVSYGTNYAVYVHERMDLRHVKGQAKFLETPLKAALRGFASRLAARVRAMIEGGKGLPIIPSHPPE